MKKLPILMFLLMVFGMGVKAQQFVSTTPTNRNVIIEEFTGRTCQYCPQGHVVGNQLMAEHPNRVWAVNVHAGGYSPTNYPNLNTTDGTAINGGFTIGAYPSGAVNRQGAGAIPRNQWEGNTTTQLGQLSEVNVGGQVVYDPMSRVASITVELYYTSNSPESTNYLTVYMLQDSIIGSQTGSGSNPAQCIGNSYCHMHILRDVVNSNDAWGDPITSPNGGIIPAGTLITRNYSYVIPETIGSPNGVDVDFNNIHFLAFVSKNHYYVLSANMLEKIEAAADPIHPVFNSAEQEEGVSCTHEKNFHLSLLNGGGAALTSLKIEATVEGITTEHVWQGHASSLDNFNVPMTVSIPFGSHTVEFNVVEANGEAYEERITAEASCDEWQDLEIEGLEEELTIEIMQDMFGNQTTWKVFDSNMGVIAAGGPYSILTGGTQLHTETVMVPANECVKFVIYDNVGNGICCQFGEGYYKVYDGNGNIIIDGNGEFGSQASYVISVIGDELPAPITGSADPELDDDKATLFGSYADFLEPVKAGFYYRTENEEGYILVEADAIESNFQRTVVNLQPGTTYYYKAFIKMTENGSPVFGEEKSFSTLVTDVAENSQNVTMYPNPVSSVLNLKANNEMASVEIYDALGRRIMEKQVAGIEMQLNVEALEDGLYLLRTTTVDGQTTTRSFAVKH